MSHRRILGNETNSGLLSQPMGDIAADTELAERILEAALRCIARWGMAKTTVDDIAREAGCSRATIYRAFPGGKQSVIHATGERELRAFLDDLSAEVAVVASLREMLTLALVAGVTAIRTHDALQYLIEHEPGPVLALVSFDRLEPLLTLGTEFGAPELERFLAPQAAREAAEWVVRTIIGHGLEADCHDLTDPAVADRFVATFMLPGLTPDLVPVPA